MGATFAFSLAQSGLADEIALIDLNENLLAGQVLDLSHGLPYYPPVNIHAGSKEDYADAQAIVITAGASQRAGESRLDLLQRYCPPEAGVACTPAYRYRLESRVVTGLT